MTNSVTVQQDQLSQDTVEAVVAAAIKNTANAAGTASAFSTYLIFSSTDFSRAVNPLALTIAIR